jgi:hypothetical protein
MAEERGRPDLDDVREALREHDEREQTEREQTARERSEQAEEPAEDDGDGD